MTSFFILAVLAASTLGYGSARNLLQEGAPVPGPSSDAPAAGLNYVQAEAGSCSQACKNSGYSQAYYFASSFVPSDPPMYACSVSTPAEGPTPAGVLAGYQANDTATCTVVQGDEVVVAHDFSCLCQDSNYIPGFDHPTSAGCSGSCTSFAGSPGQPLLTDAGKGNYGCIPDSQQGAGNRMGTAVGNICYTALEGARQTFTNEAAGDSTGFSCLCQVQAEEGVTTAG